MFGGGIPPKEVRVDDIDVVSFVKRLRDFIKKILSHDVIVELPGTSYIEGESSDFAADFAMVCFVPVVLGSSGSDFGDEVPVV